MKTFLKLGKLNLMETRREAQIKLSLETDLKGGSSSWHFLSGRGCRRRQSRTFTLQSLVFLCQIHPSIVSGHSISHLCTAKEPKSPLPIQDKKMDWASTESKRVHSRMYVYLRLSYQIFFTVQD